MSDQAVVGLDAIASMAALRRLAGDTVRGEVPVGAGQVSALRVVIDGEAWAVWVPGVHNPDDARRRRWVL